MAAPPPPFYAEGDRVLLLATSSPSIRALYATAIENGVRGIPRPSADHLRCPRDVTLPPNGSAMLDLGVACRALWHYDISGTAWELEPFYTLRFASSGFVQKNPIILSVESGVEYEPVIVRVINVSGKNIRIKVGTPLVSIYSIFAGARQMTPAMIMNPPYYLKHISRDFLYHNYLAYTGQPPMPDEETD